MTPTQSVLIAVGFVAAVFILTLGAATAYDWWKARREERREQQRLAAELEADEGHLGFFDVPGEWDTPGVQGERND